MRASAAGIALLAAVTTLPLGCMANTEIANFGPLYCRNDREGRNEIHAAHQISEEWQTMTHEQSRGIFSIPLNSPDQELLNDASGNSRAGAWIKLKMFDETKDASSAPNNPRDRFLHYLIHLTSKRYTLRASLAANHASDVHIRVMNAHEMLIAGSLRKSPTSNTTDPVDSPPEVHIGEVPPDADGQMAAPLAHKRKPRLQDSVDPSTIALEIDAELVPCSTAYVQVLAVSNPVRIPARPECRSEAPSGLFAHPVWKWVRRHYLDPLAWDAGLSCAEADATIRRPRHEAVSSIPVVLTFEPLHLGVIPATATQTLFTLLLAITLAVTFFLQPFQRRVSLADAPILRPKAE